MKHPRTAEELIKNTQKTRKNSVNPFANVLKWSNKISKLSDYDDYVKDTLTLPFIEWFIQVLIIRPIIIAICLLLIYSEAPPSLFLLAEGLSLLWFIIIELKQDLWRK